MVDRSCRGGLERLTSTKVNIMFENITQIKRMICTICACFNWQSNKHKHKHDGHVGHVPLEERAYSALQVIQLLTETLSTT